VPKPLHTKTLNPYLVGEVEKISDILIDAESYFGKVKTIAGWSRTVR